MATKSESTSQITRITYTIPKPFNQVLSRLQSSIAKHSSPSGLSILNHLDSKSSFETAVYSALGPHDFMQFQIFSHGDWTHLYGVGDGRKVVRVIFGNPLIAITMLKHDLNAGLFVPVEALLVERKDGRGTDVVYVKPSTLIAGEEGSGRELREAAEVLDGKVERLWEWAAQEEEE